MAAQPGVPEGWAAQMAALIDQMQQAATALQRHGGAQPPQPQPQPTWQLQGGGPRWSKNDKAKQPVGRCGAAAAAVTSTSSSSSSTPAAPQGGAKRVGLPPVAAAAAAAAGNDPTDPKSGNPPGGGGGGGGGSPPAEDGGARPTLTEQLAAPTQPLPPSPASPSRCVRVQGADQAVGDDLASDFDSLFDLDDEEEGPMELDRRDGESERDRKRRLGAFLRDRLVKRRTEKGKSKKPKNKDGVSRETNSGVLRPRAALK